GIGSCNASESRSLAALGMTAVGIVPRWHNGGVEGTLSGKALSKLQEGLLRGAQLPQPLQEETYPPRRRENRESRSRFSGSDALRARYSKVPPARPRSDTTIRCGMPISSMSANIGPGRRPRSSSAVSMPASLSSRYSDSAAADTSALPFGLMMH